VTRRRKFLLGELKDAIECVKNIVMTYKLTELTFDLYKIRLLAGPTHVSQALHQIHGTRIPQKIKGI